MPDFLFRPAPTHSLGYLRVFAFTVPEADRAPWADGQGRGLLQIGQTAGDIGARIKEKVGRFAPGYTVLFEEPAAQGGRLVADIDLRKRLVEKMGRKQRSSGWIEASREDVLEAFEALAMRVTPVTFEEVEEGCIIEGDFDIL